MAETDTDVTMEEAPASETADDDRQDDLNRCKVQVARWRQQHYKGAEHDSVFEALYSRLLAGEGVLDPVNPQDWAKSGALEAWMRARLLPPPPPAAAPSAAAQEGGDSQSAGGGDGVSAAGDVAGAPSEAPSPPATSPWARAAARSPPSLLTTSPG